VHAGGTWLESRLTAEVINAFSASSKSGARSEKPLLSDREMEVVQLVAQSFQNKEIGKKLFISEPTVKNHLTTSLTSSGFLTASNWRSTQSITA
jgi:two-component system NarL family response regulator